MDELRLPAGSLDLADRLPPAFVSDVRDDDARSLFREEQRGLAADTAASAGGQRNLVFQPHGLLRASVNHKSQITDSSSASFEKTRFFPIGNCLVELPLLGPEEMHVVIHELRSES